LRKKSDFRESLEYWMARAVLASLAHGPRRLAFALARVYTRLLDLAIPRLRRVALCNLAMALPELDPENRARVVDGVYRSIARLLVAFARFPRITAANVHEWIRYEGYEHFAEALRRGRGVLFATAHLGNWELSAYAHAILSHPMCVIARPLDNRRIDELVARRRTLSGNTIVDKREFARPILKALHDNQAVGILVDQNASYENGAFVDFFGVPACAFTGFAKLAARSGAAVIPGFALWSEREGRWVLRFDAPIEITGDELADTARIQSHLEQVIRQCPDQWLWIHRRWRTRPQGEAALY
jgi:Kdo2-lipid IVA lauroyltransferase/acyltransferase